MKLEVFTMCVLMYFVLLRNLMKLAKTSQPELENLKQTEERTDIPTFCHASAQMSKKQFKLSMFSTVCDVYLPALHFVFTSDHR